jgi:hypothetical protein
VFGDCRSLERTVERRPDFCVAKKKIEGSYIVMCEGTNL